MFSPYPPPKHTLLNELPDQLSQQLKNVIKQRFHLRQKAEEPVSTTKAELEPKEEPKNLKPALNIFLAELQRDIASGDYVNAQRNIKQLIHFIQDKHVYINSWDYNYT